MIIGESLKQFVVGPEKTVFYVADGIHEIVLNARGGDLVVAFGDSPQDPEGDGVYLSAGESIVHPVGGDNQEIAALSVGPMAMLQLRERVLSTDTPDPEPPQPHDSNVSLCGDDLGWLYQEDDDV